MSAPVTVCLITYNHEAFIEQALQGVFLQKTNFPFELVIADDGSTDNTRKLITEAIANVQIKTHLIFQEKNVGAIQNWKDLLAFPKSKYIAYLEGDDYWTNENKLQAQFDFLEEHQDYVLHCGHSLIESKNPATNGKKVHPQFTSGTTLERKDFALDSFVVSSTAMFRNLGFVKLPETFNVATAGDWLFWIYIMQLSKGKCYYSDAVYGVYRIHGQNAFSSFNAIKNYRFYMHNLALQKAYMQDLPVAKNVKQKLQWYRLELIRELIKEGNFSEAKKEWWKDTLCTRSLKRSIGIWQELRNAQ